MTSMRTTLATAALAGAAFASAALRRAALAGASLALFTTGSPAWASPPDAGSESAGFDGANPYADAVTARLFSDVESIAPGRLFTLALELKMAPGWHTYWENGGDAGLPTSVEWKLPDGFVAGPLLFPVPHRYEEEGDLVTFGYADRVILLTEVTAPADLTPDQRVELSGHASWLQCKDLCVPGEASLSIRLAVEPTSRPAAAPLLDAIASTRAQLPLPASALERIALHTFQSHDATPAGGAGQVALVFEGLVDFDPQASQLFPRPHGTLWFRDAQFRTDGRHLAIVVPVTVDAAARAGGTEMLPAVVRIARADGGPPWLLALEIPVSIAAAGDVPAPTNAPVFAEGGGPFLSAEALAATDGAVSPTATGASAAVPLATGRHLLRYIVLAFFGGLILNVMPCVLPVVSLKILGFVSKADEHRSKVAKLGLVFGAGVISSFLVLALVVIALRAAGEMIGWGFQFQNPVFVAALAVVVFVFALSLLGVFEIGGITAMLGLGLAAADHKAYADAFFHGVLTTILATPCTAPMLGAAVAFAFAQPPAVILIVFLSVALGLASPYVLLSLNPGWLKYVPKPGLWMDRFKQAMGFLMLATLVWLLAVLGAQLGVNGVVRMIGFLLVVGVLCWTHGTFVDLSSSKRRVRLVWLITWVGFGVGYAQILHRPLFRDRAAATAAADAAGATRTETTTGGVTWQPYSRQALTDAVDDGQTVFLDLTADWCWTCKVNEKTVLQADEVEAAFVANGVLTLKGDWTRKDPEISAILRLHNRAGVPFYAVYPAGRIDEPIVLPEIINKRIVLDSLEKAGPSRAGA